MTDKERLEEIKNSYLEGLHRLFGTPWVSMPKENFDWLIQQAERAEKNAQDLEDMDKQLASEQKRIEKLEKDLNALHYVYNLQAERVQELEKGIENLNELTDMQHEQNLRFHKQLNQLIRTNQRYKQALEFYADPENYCVTFEDDYEPILKDNGKIAREALKGETK